MKQIFILVVMLMPLTVFGQSHEPCLVELVTHLKNLDVAKVKEIFDNGDCDYEYKDANGTKAEVSKETIQSLIKQIEVSERTCQKFRSKDPIQDSDLKAIASTCSSRSKLGYYEKLVEAEKYSGVTITEYAKGWDKFIDDTRASWEKKEKDEEVAEEKFKEKKAKEADSPEGWRQRTCQTYNVIQRAKETIRKEKAAAKHSGIVDKEKMYSAGQYIENYSTTLEKQKIEYKKKSGQSWSPSLCK
jgi:hypothetical protein